MSQDQFASLQFMPGTSPGSQYLIIARRGKIALGIRPWPLTAGRKFGIAGKTYVPVRVHSRIWAEGQAQYGLDDDQNVVKIDDASLAIDTAWPNIEFESVSPGRAATTVGVFLRDSIVDHPEAVLERLKTDDVYVKIAEFIAERVGYEHLVVRTGPMIAWLREQYAGAVKQLEGMIATNKEFEETIENSLETAGFQALMLSQIYQKHMANGDPETLDPHASTDPEDVDDEDAALD